MGDPVRGPQCLPEVKPDSNCRLLTVRGASLGLLVYLLQERSEPPPEDLPELGLPYPYTWVMEELAAEEARDPTTVRALKGLDANLVSPHLPDPHSKLSWRTPRVG